MVLFAQEMCMYYGKKIRQLRYELVRENCQYIENPRVIFFSVFCCQRKGTYFYFALSLLFAFRVLSRAFFRFSKSQDKIFIINKRKRSRLGQVLILVRGPKYKSVLLTAGGNWGGGGGGICWIGFEIVSV
jgi:hypothetical protein